MKKTLLIGIDAACWEYVTPALEAGELPALQQLIDGGAYGVLRSTLPAYTPTAWSSIITGANPGKHGVYGFISRLPQSYEYLPTSARSRAGAPFWRYLNQQGVRVGLVNIPLTYPLEPLDGFAVCGFTAPNTAAGLTYPADALGHIEARFGPYTPAVKALRQQASSPHQILEIERDHQQKQVHIAAELADCYDVDVLVANLMLLDHANHYMPDFERVRQAMCDTDRHLQTLLDAFRPDNVLLISDHGSRRVQGDFLLHVWLADHGYTAPAASAPQDRARALNWVLMQYLQARHNLSGPQERLARRLLREALSALPRSLAAPIWKRLAHAMPFAHELVTFTGHLDKTRTSLYPFGEMSWFGLLCLNLKGRDPQGFLSSEEAQTISAQLTEELTQIVDPDTAQPLVRGVYSGAALYKGAQAPQAPDLILDIYDSNWNVVVSSRYNYLADQVTGRYFARNDRHFGGHSRDGLFVFSGPDFSTGATQPDVESGVRHVMDIPATLLYLYGVPIPDDYDGTVMTEAISPNYVETHPVQHQPALPADAPSYQNVYSKAEAEELAGYLRALGYME